MVTLIKYGALSGGEKYNVNQMYIDGLSTDTKPTTTIDSMSIPNGSVFTELDTGKKYMFDATSTTWYEQPSGGGGGGGGGGTSNYNELSNRPQINSTTLTGNKTSSALGLQDELVVGTNLDSAPASQSDNPVTSGGVYTALGNKVDAVSGKGLSANDFTDTLKDKLDGIESGAEANVQADWEQTDNTADDYIKGKPTIPTVNDSTITIQKNGTTVKSFTTNQASGDTINITVPTTAADVSAIPTSAKGTASGVAELDSNGKVPSSQLPSYVDDVIEGYYYNGKFYEESAHTTEITGETGKIYIDLSGTNKTYRWSGSGYTEISESLALGETSSTAYRGDRGKTAYDHATESRLTTATESGLYKVASTAEGHIASLTSVQKSDITALGIPAQDTTYTFNTAYNASTNKAATMSDITTSAENGTLTGYEKKSGNVAATDKVVEAIGKLETKADTNASNTVLLETMNGAKNLLIVTLESGSTSNLATATVNTDKTVTIDRPSANSSSSSFTICKFQTENGKQYVVSGAPSGSSSSTYRIVVEGFGYDYGSGYTFTGNGSIVNIVAEIRPNVTVSNIVFKPMIVTKAAWDAGFTDYQPYAMSNAELTNNIVLLEKYGGGKNLLNNVATDGSSGTLSWTVANDKSVTLSGSTNAANTRITLGTFTPKSGVQYVLSGCPSDGSAETFRIYGVNGNDTRLPDYGNGYTFTGDGTEYTFYIYINNSGTNMNAKVFKPMICSTADWALSHDYQTFALPNTKITPELIDLVDSGAKNLIPVTRDEIKNYNSGWSWNGYTVTNAGITITLNEDMSITLNGTSTGIVELNIMPRTANRKLFKSAGTYELQCKVPANSPWFVGVNRTVSGSGVNYGIDNGSGLEFVVNSSEVSASNGIWVGIPNGTQISNATIYPMICSKAAWDVSQKYVPYGMSNAELTAKEQANENNILLLTSKTGYNFAKIGTNSYADRGLTLTVANGVVTISGTATSSFSLYLSGTISDTLTSDIKLSSQLPTQIVFTGAPDTDTKNRIIYSLYNDGTWVYSGSTNDLYHDLSGKTYNNWFIYLPIVSGNTYNGTWRPMIIDKSIYDSGYTNYQPYAMTNAEITAWIQAHT